MNAEGWYQDPFEQHALRWFSAGVPTDLVRDEDVEAYEPPPRETWDGPLVPYLPAPSAAEQGGGDLRRVGGDIDDIPAFDPGQAADAALDSGAASGLGFS